MEAALGARTIDRLAKLMENLILADDDRVAADRNRHRMPDCGVAGE